MYLSENGRDFPLSIVENAIIGSSYFKATMSNPLIKGAKYQKITVEQRENNGRNFYQFTLYSGNQVTHENHTGRKAYSRFMEFSVLFRQCDVIAGDKSFKLLRNKNGVRATGVKEITTIRPLPKSHDNQKNYILKSEEAKTWLYALGVTNKNGVVLADKQKKFRQINKFLEIVESMEHLIPNGAQIIDAGCGKAYLTFALYDYLVRIKGKEVEITGIDLKESVLDECSGIAKSAGFDGLRFECGSIEAFKPEYEKADMLVCLHACDTATDYALALAVRLGVNIIISAPCCEHELFGQIECIALEPLLKHGILKERFSALLTDTVRAMLLEVCSYKCSVIEFTDLTDTAKNIMLKAVRKPPEAGRVDIDAMARYMEFAGRFNVNPTLYKLLEMEGGKS